MSIKSLSRRTTALCLTGLLMAGLTLAACGGAAETDTEQPVGSNQVVADSQAEATEEAETTGETETQQEEAQEDESTPATEEAEAADSENLLAPDQSLPEASSGPTICESVDIPDNPLVAQVSDSDWSKGPADASVTIVEYGDFQ